MELSDKKGVQQIVLALATLGLKEVVVCPGSRNAPLIISFNRHPAFHCTSVRDERSAAFYALGRALELQQPVAVLCTSGSAALNFAPAIVEAYYQRIPLLVLTADRPKIWTHQGDGQTINQTEIFRNYIRKSYEINGDAQTKNDLWFNARCLSEGYAIATCTDNGPVHFNIPMSEPLYDVAEVSENETHGIFRDTLIEKQLSEKSLSMLAGQFSASKKVMILIGQRLPNGTLSDYIKQIAALENVAVLTESTSNIHHPDYIENIDRCITGLSKAEIKELMPDLLITIGGSLISKRIKKILREVAPKHHWNVNAFDATMDTYQSLTNAIALEPVHFFKQISEQLKPVTSDYKSRWQLLKNKKEKAHHDFCREAAYSDFKVFQSIFKTIPATTHLHIANSSAIRYAQLFDYSKTPSTWSNRGTSGIDGSSSTAMGAASASPHKDFVLLTGDVAFHYDKNAFWNDAAPDNLKVIVVNNSGGGIFRIIPGPDKIDEREQFIETTMNTNATKIAEHYGWDYLTVRHENELENTLKAFFEPTTKKTILEIFTDAEMNPIVLDQYWKYLN